MAWYTLSPEEPLWERVFTVAPLVLVGTREVDGHFDLAPKHMVTPMSWGPYVGFVCAPSHATYQNVLREGTFTVNYLLPEAVLEGTLAAIPHEADHYKPSVHLIPTRPATRFPGVLVEDAYFCLECQKERIIDGLGPNSLIIGKVLAAHVRTEYLRSADRDDGELIYRHPLLVYLHPYRYSVVRESYAFPLPARFKR